MTISVFMASRTMRRSPAWTRCPGSTPMFHTLAVSGEATAWQPSGMPGPPRREALSSSAASMMMAWPAAAQRARSSAKACLLALLARASFRLDRVEEGLVFLVAKLRLLDGDVALAVRKSIAHVEQFGGADRIEADLIEEAKQPGRAGFEVLRALERVPHLQRAPHQLVAAGAFHAVDAEIRAADSHSVFGGPGASGIVLGGDEAMAGIDGCCHWCAEIDVAQAEDEIAGIEDDAMDVFDGTKSVNTADELDVARGTRARRVAPRSCTSRWQDGLAGRPRRAACGRCAKAR